MHSRPYSTDCQTAPRVHRCCVSGCQDKFLDRTGLLKHQREGHSMKNQCVHCNERFDHYVQLSRHVAESHGDKPVVFRCILTDCPWESDSVDAARQHARTKHYRQRAYPIEDEDGVFECEECTHCCDTITSFDVHGQADHPRSYWPVLHDVQTIGVGFPHGVFFCGLCSAPYTDAMKARHHLAEKHPALVLQIHHADVTRIDAISMYRCPGCKFMSESIVLYSDHLSSWQKRQTRQNVLVWLEDQSH